MNWILSSKLFQASDNQDKILAAASNPINKELVQQLTSYIDVDDLPDLQDDDKSSKSDSLDKSQNSDVKDVGHEDSKPDEISKHSSASTHHAPSSNNKSDSTEDTNSQPEDEVEPTDNDSSSSKSQESNSNDADNQEDTNSSTKVEASTVANTYVTVETVAQAVEELPGALNLVDDTKGVIYAELKTTNNSRNELWVYYEPEMDLNKVLSPVIKYLYTAGYYYLEFNRISRDENAFVFSVNWVSSYFHPSQVKSNQVENA